MALADFSIFNSTMNQERTIALVPTTSNVFNVDPGAGQDNICIGWYSLNGASLLGVTLTDCIILNGTLAGVHNPTITNSIAIGKQAYLKKSNECILGGSGVNVGINGTDPLYALHIRNGGQMCLDTASTPILTSIPDNAGVFYVQNAVPRFSEKSGTKTGYISVVTASGEVYLENGYGFVNDPNITANSFISVSRPYSSFQPYVVSVTDGNFTLASDPSGDIDPVIWKAST